MKGLGSHRLPSDGSVIWSRWAKLGGWQRKADVVSLQRQGVSTSWLYRQHRIRYLSWGGGDLLEEELGIPSAQTPPSLSKSWSSVGAASRHRIQLHPARGSCHLQLKHQETEASLPHLVGLQMPMLSLRPCGHTQWPTRMVVPFPSSCCLTLGNGERLQRLAFFACRELSPYICMQIQIYNGLAQGQNISVKCKNLTTFTELKESILARLVICPWGMPKSNTNIRMQALGLSVSPPPLKERPQESVDSIQWETSVSVGFSSFSFSVIPVGALSLIPGLCLVKERVLINSFKPTPL